MTQEAGPDDDTERDIDPPDVERWRSQANDDRLPVGLILGLAVLVATALLALFAIVSLPP